MKQFRPRERTAWVKKKWFCHTKEIVFANLLLYLRKKKIAKIALVVLINSEEKLELTQDRGPGHDVVPWKDVVRRDPTINEVVGHPQEMKLG